MAVIGIMQPYIFPYIGYFQLISSVEKFIIYDDVNYIKQGWINRNNILVDNKPSLFTVPLKDPSSFQLIKDTNINQGLYPIWKNKFYKTIFQNYKKAPFFEDTISLLKYILDETNDKITNLILKSLMVICDYINIPTCIIKTSQVYANDNLKGQDRIIDICLKENACQYINPIGGQELYYKDAFAKHNIKLNFIQPKLVEYKQFQQDFVPGLSIIDVLMFNSKEEIQYLLQENTLI